MKLILAIVNNEDAVRITEVLNKACFSVTRLSTTGGFLMKGNTTLLIGTEEDRVPMALGFLRQHCTARTYPDPKAALRNAEDITVGGATVFVLDIDHMEKF